MAFDRPAALSFQTHLPLIGVFLRPTAARPRRNAKPCFARVRGQQVREVSVPDGDRMLTIALTGGWRIRALLFGGRANVLLLKPDDTVAEAFRKRAPSKAPAPRTAAIPADVDAFDRAWSNHSGPAAAALSRVFPFFDRVLAAEAIARAGVTTPHAPSVNRQERSQLFRAAMSLHHQLLQPLETAYLYGDPPGLALTPMQTLEQVHPRSDHDLDEAASLYAQRNLAARSFRSQYGPLRRDCARQLERAQRSLVRLREEHARPPKDAEFERYGHLLMAAGPRAAGSNEMVVSDVFGEGSPVAVPADPALNSIENAERYYRKARSVRASRRHLDALLAQSEAKVRRLEADLERLDSIRTLRELDAYKKADTGSLRQPNRPFRRYRLTPEYEVWVGRSAAENQALTLRHARPFDLWLHARGTSGAHVVLRVPNRNARPSQPVIERAASIAAWHSKARGSALVPVIVTPRKFVRKVRGTADGEVTAMREEVVMVEPALPCMRP